DYWDQEAWKEERTVMILPGGFSQQELLLPDSLRGAFRGQLESQQNEVLAQQVISVIPRLSHTGLNPESKFGSLVHLNEENLSVAQKLGVKWTRDHWSFCWYRLEPEPGRWNFQEAEEKLEKARKYGLSVFGVLHGVPAWASVDGTQSYTSRPKDWKKWEEYVEKTVSYFKGKVRVWEVWNEPQSAEFYEELCRHTYPVAKKANPDCLVIGLSSTLFSGSFLKEFAERGNLAYLDELSSHIYHYKPGLEETFQKYSHLLGGKPVWNTEGGGWGGSTFYTTRPDYKSGRPGVQQVGKYYTTVYSLPFVRLHCYYWNVWPADYNPAFEYSWTFFEHDSSVKPEGVAYAVTAASLEGSQPVKLLAKGGVRIHIFQKEGRTILVGWQDEEEQVAISLPLSGPFLHRDIMGNERKVVSKGRLVWNLGKEVSFLERPGEAKEIIKVVEEALSGLKETKSLPTDKRVPLEIEQL
ncbi:MAG: hypothetical protein NC823_02565, partial [Candidatus Omnitrophica bacterium]|nr:hypothetical protein [Candidatus Omnitrophota bacterium]